MTTTDPSVLTIPKPRPVSSQEVTNLIQNSGNRQVNPPPPDQNAAWFESHNAEKKQEVEKYRSLMKKMEAGPYGKAAPYLLIEGQDFAYDYTLGLFNELDLQLNRTDQYTENGRLMKKEDWKTPGLDHSPQQNFSNLEENVTTYLMELNLPGDSLYSRYINLLDFPRTIEVYRQGLEKYKQQYPDKIGQDTAIHYQRELDSIMAIYNREFPKQTAEYEAIFRNTDRRQANVLLLTQWVDSSGLHFFETIYKRLESIKNAGFGLKLDCQLYKARTRTREPFESPICDFGLRFQDYPPGKAGIDNYLIKRY
jgi:hypothetical protein